MLTFSFRSPSLFEPAAEVQSPRDRFHDAPGVAEDEARRRRFAVWLKSRLSAHGYTVEGPEADEEGWIIAIPSGHASAQFVIYGDETDEEEFVMDLILLGDADPEIGRVTDTILRRAPEISGLTVR